MIEDVGEKTSLLFAMQGISARPTVHAGSMAQPAAPDLSYIDF
jgi:hypothetical protein